MAIETKRRFLVTNYSWRENAFRSQRVQQGYLSDDPERIVRVRITYRGLCVSNCALTIKGLKSHGSGLEFKYLLTLQDAKQMLELCKQPILDKTRHLVDVVTNVQSDFYGSACIKQRWEIDEFHSENEGLIIAELELDDVGEDISLPDWIGEEVTDKQTYANSNLVKHPYKDWNIPL